ncbi:glycosyltransferase [Colwellia sp. Bg11-28]|uniref:glycosyltransferase n=1 Tax=Colwellia sp. Bg11-28 TaxID=2058305 RepID=UPI000C34C6E8|nr:glycosyltransferase family A protein [Colwellia sp. Bg11-28]PKH86149.1 glycosyl transferase family 2 [Colwellia sp. Bg11-28]
MNKSYVIISPCRNEEKYMLQTLDTVVNQTIKPAKWIIVDDGSTDRTPQILSEYESKYDFIEIVTRENRGHRSVGPGVIDAFYEGYNTINIDDYAYICKLDLDLNLPETYFDFLMKQMEIEPRLGTYSGKPYFYEGDSNALVAEVCGDESSVGATKFYRTQCFKEIGGFVRQVMWDGIDSHRCRTLGWISRSDDKDEIRYIHLRPMGSSQNNIITGRIRHGYGQYFMGSSFIYLLASVVYRLNKKPYVIGALATLWGYVKSIISKEEQLDDPHMKKLLRKFQLYSLIIGKQKTVEKINAEQASVWGTLPVKYIIPIKR